MKYIFAPAALAVLLLVSPAAAQAPPTHVVPKEYQVPTPGPCEPAILCAPPITKNPFVPNQYHPKDTPEEAALLIIGMIGIYVACVIGFWLLVLAAIMKFIRAAGRAWRDD